MSLSISCVKPYELYLYNSILFAIQPVFSRDYCIVVNIHAQSSLAIVAGQSGSPAANLDERSCFSPLEEQPCPGLYKVWMN